MNCKLIKTSGGDGPKSQGQASFTYRLTTDATILSPHEAIALAEIASPDPVPRKGSRLANTFLFVQTRNASREIGKLTYWDIEVTCGPPPEGEDEEQQEQQNPLLRPPVYDIQYVEQEYVIEQARNVTELTGGFTRPANSLGPIVNAAFRRPDSPFVDTERNGVVVIEKNYPSLGAMMSLNESFQRTCNSDTVTVGGESIGPRRLKYLVTRSGGKQTENGIVYYPGVTEIEIKKTTDLIIDNVGFEYWDSARNDYVRALDADDEPTAEPVNLNLDGTRKTSGEKTTITYRHLDEAEYADFFR